MSESLPIRIPPGQQAQVFNRLLDGLIRSPSGCWEWAKSRNDSGYGKINVNGRLLRCNRLAFFLFCGPIPDGLYVCHRCDNPPCCHPAHLFLGTNSENQFDSISKGRPRGDGGCVPLANRLSGQRNHLSKLTATQVEEIRRSYQPRVVTYKMLARRYNVHPESIMNVILGRTWLQTVTAE